jgi:2-dehydro-3-deoxy-D-arabinonate dehydratase
MKLAKARRPDGSVGFGIIDDKAIHFLAWPARLGDLLNAPLDPAQMATILKSTTGSLPLSQVSLMAPVDRQEIWASGVTYKRSKIAREEESAGAASFYDKVYTANRPELFLKASPWRVVHPGGNVRIRADGKWNVPEPELALVISPAKKIVGYTIGNDMSSRDIEGENPLYLPQAKIYDGSCAIGPCITLASAMPKELDKIGIHLQIERNGKTEFDGKTNVGQIARPLESLVEWLCKELTFPDGAILMTGTGIVPPDSFTLAAGDLVRITIDGIGTLINAVA